MALKSTIFKIRLSVANITTHHYEDYNLTLARHPSESDERMMYRLVAFALHANQDLVFGKGVSNVEEPDLWIKSLDGQIKRWIDLGQPDEKRIRQTLGKSETVSIYGYQLAASQIWWESLSHKTRTHPDLEMYQLVVAEGISIGAFVHRGMQLSCTIEDGEVLLAGQVDGEEMSLTISVKPYQKS